MKIPESLIQEIASRVNIVEVLGRYLTLKRSGSRYLALCPFHNEKTPSLSVDPDRGMWYCFGCKEGGNVFSFLMKMEGMGFPEAVAKLAAEVGVELVTEEGRPQDTRLKRGYQLLNRVAEYYSEQLLKRAAGQAGRDYLLRRRISKGMAERFRLGFAPPQGRDDFLKMLKAAGFTPTEALECGVLSKGQYGLHELLGGRLIFPICDFQGKVVAFGGRAKEDRGPKYINSPENPWYSKRRHLYGLNVARGQIAREDRAILVEGYLDVISMHQVGLGCTLASLGTALTSEQAKLLERYTRQVILAYDGDEAGAQAILKGHAVLEEEGLLTMVVTWPPGEDPDSLAQQGRERVESCLASRTSIIKFQIERLVRQLDLKTQDGRERYLRAMMPFIEGVKDWERRDAYIRELAYYAGIPEVAVYRRLRPKARQLVPTPVRPPKPSRNLESQEELLNLLTWHPLWIAEVKDLVELERIEDPALRQFFTRLWSLEIDEDQPLRIERLSYQEDPPAWRQRLGEIMAHNPTKAALEDARKLARTIRDRAWAARLRELRPLVAQALNTGEMDGPLFKEYRQLQNYFRA